MSGSCDSGSFVRKTDRMAPVTYHVERGEGNIPGHNMQHIARVGRHPGEYVLMGFSDVCWAHLVLPRIKGVF